MRIFVTPRPGILVRDPRNLSEQLPAEGAWVIDHVQWRRHERDGDVTVSTTGPVTASKDQEKRR